MRKSLLFCVLIISIASTACKKEKPAPVQPQLTHTAWLENRTSAKIWVDLYHYQYKEGASYASQFDSLVKRVEIEPNSKLKIPAENMVNGARYFYQWHNEDYTLTNWMPRWPVVNITTSAPLEDIFTYNGTHSGVAILHTYPTDERIVCLNGGGKETVWQAVDAYDSLGTSIWGTLNPSLRTHTLVMNAKSVLTDSNFRSSTGASSVFQAGFLLMRPFTAQSFWLEARPGHNLDDHIVMKRSLLDEFKKSNLSTIASDTLFYYVSRYDAVAGASKATMPLYKFARVATRY